MTSLLRAAATGCVVLFALSQTARAQQTGTIVGRVVDSSTMQPRRGATATIASSGQTATTNERGTFTLARVAAGDHAVRVRLFGFQSVVHNVPVRAGDTTHVTIVMLRDPAMLDAVQAIARSPDRQLFESALSVGAVTLSARALEAVPRLGEADVVRVVQLLPGVQAKNDFSTGYSVHGGESDQNLILLDGYPIYNPFHLGGLFSTFISPTVKDLQLHTSALPAEYGGRLSSVLDITSAEESRTGIHGTADVSVLASTLALGSSFADGKGTWMIAGRRTYADQAARLLTSEVVPYHFRDEQAHLTYELPHRTRLSMSLYDGRDLLDGSFAQIDDSTHLGGTGGGFTFSWGNLVAGATLTSIFEMPMFGDSVRFEQRVSTSRFSTFVDLGSESATLRGQLRDSRIGGALTAFGATHQRTAGYEIASYDISLLTKGDQTTLDTRSTTQSPVVGALYIDDLWRASPSIILSAGLRAETVTGASWTSVSPRLSAKYLASSNSAFTAAAGRFSQWTHSMALEDNPIRLFDFWQGSDSVTPVSTAWQFVLGHEHWLSTSRFIRVETFYKRYDNLLEHNDQENPAIAGDDFFAVTGTSYGADVLLKQLDVGPFSGWLAYTYTMSTRQHDSVRYAPSQDRRHDFNAVLSWRLAQYVIGARLGVASGMPYTDVIAAIPRRKWDSITGVWGGEKRVSFEAEGAERNGARLPATQRLDLYVERSFKRSGATFTPYLSVVNATNHTNILYYNYEFTTSPATRQGLSQIPILPSVGLSVVF